MRIVKLSWALVVFAALLSSCGSDDPKPNKKIELNVPETYKFEKDGKSTVSFSGQTTRLKMVGEIVSAMSDKTKTSEQIKSMLKHKEKGNDFSNADLNASSKNVGGKIAASKDYFSSNSIEQAAIRADFDKWIDNQVSNVFKNWSIEAEAGKAGFVKSGTKTRYVDAKGLEMNQVLNKALMGALIADQINNNYTSATKLDAVKEKHEAGTPDKDGVAYTTMEHNWDEGYGYLFGNTGKDILVYKYAKKLNSSENFKGILDTIEKAFIKGRAAIIAKQYDIRNEQASIIRENISKIIAVRAVHYLLSGKSSISADKAILFHDLSEAYGFIYSLQFTRKPGDGVNKYFSKSEVDAMLKDLTDDGSNGLWDVKAETLQTLADKIAKKFGFEANKAI